MIRIGKTQSFTVAKKSGKQWILKNEDNDLIPLSPTEENFKLKVGEEVEAFVYTDKSNELIATLKKPKIEVGQVRPLRVVTKTRIGAFVDIGLDKDVLFPFGEQQERVQEGKTYLFYMYEDRSKRLAVTTQIKEHLTEDSPYQKGDSVEGMVYHHKRGLGLLIAIDNLYDGLVPEKEVLGIYSVGDKIQGRVIHRLEDGKLTVTMRDKKRIELGREAEIILKALESHKGKLPIGDRSTPEKIYELTGLSKSAFKRGVGRLYKEQVVEPSDYETRKIGEKHGK